MKWKHPPKIKIYEALGAMADKRIEVFGNSAKVYSSSRNKAYEVKFDKDINAIMANDNGSYWRGYLGYPSIALLLQLGYLSFDPELSELLRGIKWKDINVRFKNDFSKTREFIELSLTDSEKDALTSYVENIDMEIKNLKLDMLGTKIQPPKGY